MADLKLPKVYPILDVAALEARGAGIEAAAEAMLAGGAGILQFRHKGHWGREVFNAAARVAALCLEAKAIFIVNDRADFAMLLGAGLHLGQDDLPPVEARALWNRTGQTVEPIIGFSTHNPDQLRAAAAEPVDYVALGPVFATASKQNPDPVVGIEKLRQVRAGVSKPLVGIGGITLANAADVLRSGADSVAVIAALLPNPCTPQTIRQRMEEWNQLATAVS